MPPRPISPRRLPAAGRRRSGFRHSRGRIRTTTPRTRWRRRSRARAGLGIRRLQLRRRPGPVQCLRRAPRREIAIAGTAAETEAKRAALAVYASERRNLRHIAADREACRPLPAHDYGRPPHAGILFRERFHWVPFRHPGGRFRSFRRDLPGPRGLALRPAAEPRRGARRWPRQRAPAAPRRTRGRA